MKKDLTPKWHFFSSLSDYCKIKIPGEEKPFLQTLCGRPVSTISFHTEFWSRVNCKKCLQRQVQFDKYLLK